jgi:hypothetical protein
MSLVLILPVTWMPVAYCEACGQDMPADHSTHIETAPEAPGAARTEKGHLSE